MTAVGDIRLALTEHLEGPADASSKLLFEQSAERVRCADALGFQYAWFAEHHAHVHRGHLPTPLLFALHMAGQTKQIALGTAVLCLNQHRAIDIAEQVAVADVLSGGRMAIGFGSGSTPAEAKLFGLADTSEDQRHAAFDRSLHVMNHLWCGAGESSEDATPFLPRPGSGLMQRCWAAVNSVGAAAIAGKHHLNVLLSHLRTPVQYQLYTTAYRASGGKGLIAANRPLILGESDEHAAAIGEDAVRRLWRRFQAEGKIAATIDEPVSLKEVCAHPLNFIIGGPESVASQIQGLHAISPFDVLNVEVCWDGLAYRDSLQSLDRLARVVRSLNA